MKKLFTSFLAVLILTAVLFSSVAAAATGERWQARKSLVALGDSVTFGYNLGNNEHPSPLAFPFIMGLTANLNVTNLGVPGMTSGHMLEALLYNESYRQAVAGADYITLQVGSNDLLQAIKASGTPLNPALLQQNVAQLIPVLMHNLQVSISEIRSLNAKAPIAVYNIYNPYQVSDPIHTLADQLLTNYINNRIAELDIAASVEIADAFGAFGDNQRLLVRPDDIHPTVLGQLALTKAGLTALQLIPPHPFRPVLGGVLK